jgi:ATP-dependent exoDNAse (exonuclease V) alpha subunit
MAIYHLNLKTLGRAAGSSAVSAAAYRAGERIRDERTGRTYDHSGRRDVLHKEIMLPNQFAAEKMSWAKDRSSLWNTAESAEARRDARTAREYLVALPAELSPQARINLVMGFSRELVERYRFALDIAIHTPRNYPDSDARNFHAHLLATTREVTPSGLGAKTTLEWSDTNRRKIGLGRAVGELLYVRERWALAANAALEHEHVSARIDHRTLKAQGIDREPKPHIPRAAFEMERHGHHSVVAERIRADYQARVEARLQRAAQHEQTLVAPKSFGERAKEFAQRWFRYRQPQPAQPAAESNQSLKVGLAREVLQKSLDTLEREAAQSRVQYQQPHEDQSKRPQAPAMESALRWKAKYGQELGKVQAKARTHEREQTELAPSSASRSRGRDFDLSL